MPTDLLARFPSRCTAEGGAFCRGIPCTAELGGTMVFALRRAVCEMALVAGSLVQPSCGTTAVVTPMRVWASPSVATALRILVMQNTPAFVPSDNLSCKHLRLCPVATVAPRKRVLRRLKFGPVFDPARSPQILINEWLVNQLCILAIACLLWHAVRW